MKNRRLRFLISLVLSLLLVVQSFVPVAAGVDGAPGVVGATGDLGATGDCEEINNAKAGTPENLEEVQALVEVLDSDGDEMTLDELDDDDYDGFIYSVKDDVKRSEIREMESEIDALPGKSEVEEIVSNELYAADSLETISEVASADMIEYVEPDYINYLDSYSSTPNDYYYDKGQTTTGQDVSVKSVLACMNVQKVWERGFFGSSDVTVAIIDSGVNETHEELVGKVVKNLVVDGGSVTRFDNSDKHFHGSFIAGIICAENNNGKGVTGDMPGVRVSSYKIFHKSNGYTAKNSNIIKAIERAVDDGVDVINMSFGTDGYSNEVKAACENAIAKGVILVASAGNAEAGKEVKTATYPAAYDCVVGVGSVDSNTLNKSSFSYLDADVVAPGEKSSGLGFAGLNYDGSTVQYTIGKGTSFAGPHVAALAAMAKSIDNDITASEFMSVLYGTAVDLGAAGKDSYYGHGLVDYEAVLNELVGENGRGDGQTVDISSAEVEYDTEGISGVYDGSPKEPGVLSVKLGGRVLTADKDYTVKYENNVSVGTAKVIVKGINQYSGKIVATFGIWPKAAVIGTPARAKNSITVKWTAVKGKMKTSRITGYQVQLATDAEFTTGLKKATVSGYSKTSKAFTKLKRRTKYYVRVRTYMKVDDKLYCSDWSEVKSVKTK